MRQLVPARKVAPTKKAVLDDRGKAARKGSAPRSVAAKKRPASDGETNLNKTRQRILDVATQEFAAKGYDGARASMTSCGSAKSART